jgi:hypothetical protein
MSLRDEAAALARSRARRSPKQQQIETEHEREERLKKGRLARQQLRQRLAEDDDAVLTFREWCALNGFSERQGHRILSEPGGPTVTKLSDKRIGISRRNNRAWQDRSARSQA